MAAAPLNSERSPDLQLVAVELKTSNLPETEVTIAQLPPPPKNTSTLAPLTPSPELQGEHKRKRLKPERLESSSIKANKKRLYSKDQAGHDPSRKRLRLGKKNATKDSNAPVQISQTMIRAREVQSTLGNEHPTFIKTMVKSHVTICFWMGLPLPFCRSFLPKHDSLMVIEDENGEQSKINFIANKSGLSGGWGKFAKGHKLLEGDVLIFQLVESHKFKVYIVRANDSKEVGGAVNVITHEAHAEYIAKGLLKITNATGAMVKTYSKAKGKRCSSSLPVTKVKRKYTRSKPPTQLSSHHTDPSVVNSQVQGESPEPNLLLKELKTFKDFHIMVDKRCIDSELSGEIRLNYYNLCIGKNEILHDGVREGLFYKLVAGVIGETVNIANMIRNCKLTTRKEEFDAWDSSLESFQLMGMKVGFLRDRIRALANHSIESEDAKRYMEAKEERNRNVNEIKALEAKLVELYETNRKLDGVVDGFKEKAEKYELEFQKKVDAPW